MIPYRGIFIDKIGIYPLDRRLYQWNKTFIWWVKKEGRYWVHPDIGLAIEIPDRTLAGDYNKVTVFPIGQRKVYVIGIEDIILDRLRAAVHWKSGVDREWGYRLLYTYFEKIDLDYLYNHTETLTEKTELQIWIKKVQNEKE